MNTEDEIPGAGSTHTPGRSGYSMNYESMREALEDYIKHTEAQKSLKEIPLSDEKETMPKEAVKALLLSTNEAYNIRGIEYIGENEVIELYTWIYKFYVNRYYSYATEKAAYYLAKIGYKVAVPDLLASAKKIEGIDFTSTTIYAIGLLADGSAIPDLIDIFIRSSCFESWWSIYGAIESIVERRESIQLAQIKQGIATLKALKIPSQLADADGMEYYRGVIILELEKVFAHSDSDDLQA